MKKAAIEITGEKGTRKLTAEFDDEEWGHMREFCDYCSELAQIRLFKKGGTVRFNVTLTRDGLQDNTVIPSDEIICELLHELRPFVLEKEATHFYRICNTVARRFEDGQIRDSIAQMEKVYQSEQFRKQVKIEFNNTCIINSDKTLDAWLNGFEYHRNGDKRLLIAAINEILPMQPLKAVFLHMLIEKTTAIFTLRNFLLPVLNIEKTVTLRIPQL